MPWPTTPRWAQRQAPMASPPGLCSCMRPPAQPNPPPPLSDRWMGHFGHFQAAAFLLFSAVLAIFRRLHFY